METEEQNKTSVQIENSEFVAATIAAKFAFSDLNIVKLSAEEELVEIVKKSRRFLNLFLDKMLKKYE